MLSKKFAFAVVLIATAAYAAVAQTKVPLTHETMWMLKRVGAPAPSPDGKWVVFSLVEPAYDEKEQVSDLWIVPTDGSARSRRLTSTKGGESGVAWSPDSRQIAFSARREGDEASQLYVLDVADGGEAQRVTSLSTGARAAQWRPDGKALLFVSSVYPGAIDDHQTFVEPACDPGGARGRRGTRRNDDTVSGRRRRHHNSLVSVTSATSRGNKSSYSPYNPPRKEISHDQIPDLHSVVAGFVDLRQRPAAA